MTSQAVTSLTLGSSTAGPNGASRAPDALDATSPPGAESPLSGDGRCVHRTRIARTSLIALAVTTLLTATAEAAQISAKLARTEAARVAAQLDEAAGSLGAADGAARLAGCRRIASDRVDCRAIVTAFGGRACHVVAVRAAGRRKTAVDIYDCPMRRHVPPKRFAAGAKVAELMDLLTLDCPLAEGISVCDDWVWGDFDFDPAPLLPTAAALGVRGSPLSESEARAFTQAFARELQWGEGRVGAQVRSRMPGPCQRLSDDRIDCELLRQEPDALFHCRFVVSTVRRGSGFADTRPYACPMATAPTPEQEATGEALLDGIRDLRRWFCGWRPAVPFETLDPDAPQDEYCGPGGWEGIPDGGRPRNRYVCWYRTVVRMHRHGNGRLHRHERETEKCVRV